MSDSPSAATLDRVRQLLRRDLMLGPDAQIGDDQALFGGDFDLDSLDVLLLVTSVEKEFGIKIPNERVGQDVFANVRSLAAYIDSQPTRKPA